MSKSQNGIYQKDISKNQNISFKYLDQIISALKAAGLITNVKGKKSGYIITREPHEITIYEIYKAFEPEISIVECLSKNVDCPYENCCACKDFWEGLNTQIIEYLSKHTLDDLVKKQLSYKSHSGQDSQNKA